jgi:CheY-like chemotaxis protein
MKIVLLVDDNRLVKLVHQRLLTKAGYNVVTAADGEEALTVARQVTPDVILLDMMLPKISGQEVLRRLKDDSTTSHIPVIVVTGLSRKNAAKLENDGAEAFIEKECLLDNAEPLLHAIGSALDQAAAGKQIATCTDVALAWTANEIEGATGTLLGS